MWNKKQIEDLQKAGKIQGFKLSSGKGNKVAVPQPFSAAKNFIELNLQKWCNDHAVSLVREHRFDTERKWRFDFAIPSMMIAVEYEGIFSPTSRHTHIKGFQGDIAKYNKAAQLGWKVLRFTANNYKDLIKELNQCII